MKKVLKWFGLALLVVFLLAQIAQPKRTNPPVEQSRTLNAHAQLPPDVQAILERSCYDCHSNQTKWPWYSRVTPANFLLVHDVDHGRDHLNFSEWSTYTEKSRKSKLEEICEEVEQNAMPLKKYLVMHPDAKVSDPDKEKLCAWTKAEQKRMAGPPAAGMPEAKEAKPEHDHKDHKH